MVTLQLAEQNSVRTASSRPMLMRQLPQTAYTTPVIRFTASSLALAHCSESSQVSSSTAPVVSLMRMTPESQAAYTAPLSGFTITSYTLPCEHTAAVVSELPL